MFLFHHQNLFKNWDYYSWRFQNFLWKHPPTQMKVWCSLLKIHVAIGALSLRITEKTGLRAQNEPQTIYGEMVFFKLVVNSCFAFRLLKAEVCCALQSWLTHPRNLQCFWIAAPGAPCQTVWARKSHLLWQPGCSLWSPVLPLQQILCQISKMKFLSKTVFECTTSSDRQWVQQPVICCTW